MSSVGRDRFVIHGMTCGGCVASVKAKLEAIVASAEVTLDPPEVTVPAGVTSLEELQAALQNTRYRLQRDLPEMESRFSVRDWFQTYRPLLLIVSFILGSSLLVQLPSGEISSSETMRYFMAGFFLVFSFFKLLDVRSFADAYASYDLLAGRTRLWGLIYPFIELALGIAYLVNIFPFVVNSVTLIVMAFSAIGVLRAVLSKQIIRCACLGTVFQLPMSTVTIIEDAGMAVMAALALVMI
ncbi:MAG: MauE/DoxX family redox-associated membrane protein [Betaproteobacteria bacterium]